MKFLSRFLFILALIAVIGVVGFLATWDMPPPSHRVEKDISHEKMVD